MKCDTSNTSKLHYYVYFTLCKRVLILIVSVNKVSNRKVTSRQQLPGCVFFLGFCKQVNTKLALVC